MLKNVLQLRLPRGPALRFFRIVSFAFTMLVIPAVFHTRTMAAVRNSAQDAISTPTPVAEPAASPGRVFGFRDFNRQSGLDAKFLAVPDPKLAEQHLRTLTSAPHIAGSNEDRKTAEYVAAKFRAAGLQTEIKEYKVWMDYPDEVSVDITAPHTVKMHGPTREHVEGDPYQDNPRVVQPFNGSSASGDVEADVVYANFGRPEDFKKLDDLKIDVRGKIVLVRYGANFRGVKVFVAQQHGAAGVIIYSDPIDDGYFKGDQYPKGPYRPETGVQRGSVQFMFEYPGDPTTPGFASTLSLPESKRVSPSQATSLPKIPAIPLSYHDALPILENLAGPESPRDWQGALPFTYHIGPGPVRIKMHVKQNYAYRTIWDVIGRVQGSELPDEWVLAGNHRDAWVYGAVDPSSGTAAMLESVHGLGELLKSGYKPRRTILFASWDAEEQGLIGSTEWGEENAADLRNAVAYFNMDVGVSGSSFGASAVPTLKQFVREVTRQVPSPAGGTVYEQWKKAHEQATSGPLNAEVAGIGNRNANAKVDEEVEVGDLGSGSDYSVFLQHLAIPATDVGSNGPYGVYHSAFDNFAWFTKFGDPEFKYEQEMARVFGIEVLHMAETDVLPYDYRLYGKEISIYLENAKRKAERAFKANPPNFDSATEAAVRLTRIGERTLAVQNEVQKLTPISLSALNDDLLQAERGLVIERGLPGRPWFRHAIYAPGEYTGYAAVVIPGVNEGIDAKDRTRTQQQLDALTAALNRAAETLEKFSAGQ